MTEYKNYNLYLTNGQLNKLKKSIKNSSPITLRVSNTSQGTSVPFLLTERQINKLEKAKKINKACDIKFSTTQIIAMKTNGGALGSLLMAAAPLIGKYAVAPLVTGAMGALGRNSVNKIFGKGLKQAIPGEGMRLNTPKGNGMKIGPPGSKGKGMRLNTPKGKGMQIKKNYSV